MNNLKEILDYVTKIKEDIAMLRIRGATKIAVTAMETIKKVVKEVSDNDLEPALRETIKLLYWSRPTEPAMQNGLNYIESTFNELIKKNADTEEIRVRLSQAADEYLELLKRAFMKIVEIGWRRIPDNGIIMTHCHSTTVVQILRKAKENGRRVTVIASETRPLYQGRRTTRELAESGIKVFHIVDSAMRWAARKFKPDLAIIGADAIGSNGVVVNKIGSKLLALVAKEFDFPLYVTASLLKLDLKTVFGEYIPIEMRDPKEVWPNAPEGVEILNPAFETVAPEFIDAIITEAGVIPPSNVVIVFKELYPKIWRIVNKEL